MQPILNRCQKFVQLLLPQSCLLCGAASGRGTLCPACHAELPRLPPERCAICALPLSGGGTCGACITRLPHFDGVTAAFTYGFPVDALVQALKYGNSLPIADVLGEALATAAAGEAPDCLVPMPLSVKRLRRRGFNQALEIARGVSARTGIPVVCDLCHKAVDTPPQAGLPWKERARNVRGAFACNGEVGAARIAVIDDVMTTGATLNELARCLKRAGAADVRGWIVARALRRLP
jgi:ComF family protein